MHDLPTAGAPSPGPLGAWLRTTFASFGVRNFRLFYLGQGASLVGTWVRRTALGWLVFQLTGSHALLGTVMGLALLPMFLLSATAGALADRVDKRRLIVATQVGATVVSLAIGLLVLTGAVRIWHLMVLATLGGIAFAFEIPARQAFVIEMVGRRNLLNAVALNSAMVNLSRIVGPAVAGLLMGTVGIAWCFLLDGLSYLAVVATLLRLRLPPAVTRARQGSHWQELMEGFRTVQRNRRVRVLLLLLFLMGTFGWSFQTLMPAIAQEQLHMGEVQYGLLMSMFGVGAIASALLVAARAGTTGPRGARLQVFGGIWLLVAGGLGISISRAMLPLSLSLAVAGFGGVMFLSTSNTLVQTGIDDAVRGRIMGIWAVGFGGSLPLGSFLVGLVAEVVPPFQTVALFSLVLLAASLWVWRRLPRRRPAAADGGAI